MTIIVASEAGFFSCEVGYSQRVIGFFAERMCTVWLRKNKLRIKELSYIIIR
jgi:hypothetical protein